MLALSLDIRERIVARYHEGKETYKEIAALFRVGESTVTRLLRRERERGDLRPDPHGGGYPPRMGDEALPNLAELVAENPARTLPELCEEWVARFGGRTSHFRWRRQRPHCSRSLALSSSLNRLPMMALRHYDSPAN